MFVLVMARVLRGLSDFAEPDDKIFGIRRTAEVTYLGDKNRTLLTCRMLAARRAFGGDLEITEAACHLPENLTAKFSLQERAVR